MAWCNSYPPPTTPKVDQLYGPDPYDVNFCFKIIPEALENERVQLTPIIPRVHSAEFFSYIEKHPELYRFYPFHAAKTHEELLLQLELLIRRDPTFVLFAIIDKTRENAFAGVIGLLHTIAQHSITEIGYVLVFPPFQRTHVTSNATGLLLHYCLEVPSASPPGLGLRRVEWRANVMNRPSVAAAERMGMRMEGTLRWHYILPEGKEGNATRVDDPYKGVGRDSVMLSMCWDDWENGSREKVQEIMARQK